MQDFRVDGITAGGKPIQAVVSAENLKTAKAKLKSIADKKQFKIDRISRRRAYLYKVRKGQERPTFGEQTAFSRDEVLHALERLGYKVHYVRAKWFDLKLKPPSADIVTFVRVSADLLRQKLPFNEILQLLINDIQHKSLRDSIKEVYNDLRQGKDSEESFVRQEAILGRFTARMLGLASKSGSMSEIYEATAIFLERRAEFKKAMKSALLMPLFTLLVLFAAVIFYVAYIFPETARLFEKIGAHVPPMTKATLVMSDWLMANMTLILVLFFVTTAASVYLLTLDKVKFYRDKYIIRIPVLGSLIHKTVIEIFCRVFYALYSGSGENIDAIKLSAEACGNKYMEHQIKTVSIPLMLSKGAGLVESFEASGVFTKTALARFHSGAETGTVKQSALQIANYYEKETVYRLKNTVEVIQIFVAMIILVVMTLLTLVSSETAFISPTNY